jgi:excinuclease ABC subunit A
VNGWDTSIKINNLKCQNLSSILTTFVVGNLQDNIASQNKRMTTITKSQTIHIKGAKVHNLKNIELKIAKNKLTVITGLSGSGKSSLAFDTLYAEGQRRYIESLSSYARQFLGKLEKPEVDFIKGIAPAIAIEQKVNSRNPRSTVGTSTEVYDYLKLLFARIGKTISPVSGKEVKKDTSDDVLIFINKLQKGTKAQILSEIAIRDKEKLTLYLKNIQTEGFNRIEIDGENFIIEDALENPPKKFESVKIIIDRIAVDTDNEENNSRIYDSIETAFQQSNGTCEIQVMGEKKETTIFSSKFELDGIEFNEPNEYLFSFNNPLGACPTCEGYGKIIGIDEDLVIPNKNLSIYEEAIMCWRGDKMSEWSRELIKNATEFDFPIHKPFYELTSTQKKLLWTGNKYFKGLNEFFKFVESQSYKIQYRILLSRYKGKTICGTCEGKRLRPEAHYIQVQGKNITDLVDISLEKTAQFFNELVLTEQEHNIAKRILTEITHRIQFLLDVGLGYLTLNRLSSTLSGGESQRINLATSLGSSLVGSMYILDEPSIGLHSRDTERLIKVLKSLRDIGNTVIVVEHDEDIMKVADEIIDMGPFAGTHGGELVFQGNHTQLIASEESLTAQYLTKRKVIEVPETRKKSTRSIQFLGCRENNLKGIDVSIPLNVFATITGVSGSGKSSLIKHIIYPALKKVKGGHAAKTGDFIKMAGDIDHIDEIEFIDQNPIGKSSRSNPATYVKAYDDIRALFANLTQSKVNGYKTRHFSFNTEGGRCESCGGDGELKVNMQFMADISLICDECKGKRFKNEVLEIKFQEHSIFDILELTISDAIEFFNNSNDKFGKKVAKKLLPLEDVGLGYLKLGQSSSTLSGGEAQRIKLASFLVKEKSAKRTLFIFDEPTTGLHFEDIQKLLKAFYALIDKGNSLLVIEHNLDVIKCADWVLDLGPEGGEKGGNIVAQGTPEAIVLNPKSVTGMYLKEKLN